MTATSDDIVITGVGLAVPGLGGAADLLGAPSGTDGFDPATGLTGREMRNKDRASRLALHCAHTALRDAGLVDADGYTGDRDTTAVVVSSNLGTLEGLCQAVDTIAEQTVVGLSPLGLPGTSSNVVAGWVAIRYGLRGPNLTVCNGATSGLDALYWARNLIAAGRAGAAVVVGVEPANEAVTRMLGRPSTDVAAALVLEPARTAAARAADGRATIGRYARTADLAGAVAAATGGAEAIGLRLTGADLEARLGPCSGALGVLQVAAAAAHLSGGGRGPVLATTGGAPEDDAAAALVLTACGH